MIDAYAFHVSSVEPLGHMHYQSNKSLTTMADTVDLTMSYISAHDAAHALEAEQLTCYMLLHKIAMASCIHSSHRTLQVY